MRMVGLLLLAPAAFAQEKPAELCAISGTVVNSVTGEPVGKVAITAESEHVLFTTTDAAGHFSLEGVPPGRYGLSGQRSGFLKTN
jgi:hypothetical protein